MATKSKPTQFGSEEKTYRADLRVDVIDSEKGSKYYTFSFVLAITGD